jgi:hypothetical protein
MAHSSLIAFSWFSSMVWKRCPFKVVLSLETGKSLLGLSPENRVAGAQRVLEVLPGACHRYHVSCSVSCWLIKTERTVSVTEDPPPALQTAAGCIYHLPDCPAPQPTALLSLWLLCPSWTNFRHVNRLLIQFSALVLLAWLTFWWLSSVPPGECQGSTSRGFRSWVCTAFRFKGQAFLDCELWNSRNTCHNVASHPTRPTPQPYADRTTSTSCTILWYHKAMTCT